jgi:multidrug efflux pump subunit AcrB
VDATVAQPIEAQIVGVDKMMYMRSVSGDDGSYTLTVSFELGTDPDINPSTSTIGRRSRSPACRRTFNARASP